MSYISFDCPLTQNMMVLYFTFFSLFFLGAVWTYVWTNIDPCYSISGAPQKILFGFLCLWNMSTSSSFWLRKQWGTHNTFPSALKRHLEVMLWRQHEDRFIEAATPNPSFGFVLFFTWPTCWRKNGMAWIFHLLLAGFMVDGFIIRLFVPP